MTTRSRISTSALLRLMRFDKPIGTLLLLWPTVWALWIAAQGIPKLPMLMIFLAGVVTMRAAGCVINDLADRHIDGKVTRTKTRVLVTGEVTLKQAMLTLTVLCLIALGLALQLNALAIQFAILAMIITFIYPFCKRFTHWPQVVLGAAWGCSTLIAFAAVHNTVPPIAWLLYLITVLWTLVFDTEYAMVDRADDLQWHIGSSAIALGRYDRLLIAILQMAFIILWLFAGYQLSMTPPFYSGLLAAGLLFVYQQYLMQTKKPANYFKAFLNNHCLGLFISLGILLHYGL